MKEFKAGDKVYFPTLDRKVHLLVETTGAIYKLGLPDTESTFAVTLKGQWCLSDRVPAIFHATQENRELLEKLYGVEFEAPPFKTVSVTLEVPEPFEPKLNEMYWYLDDCCEVNVSTLNTDLGSNPIKFKWRTKKEAVQALNMINTTFGMPL